MGPKVDVSNAPGQFFKAQDGTEIYYNIWRNDKVPPKAVLLAMHGLGEHIHRYDHVFSEFKDAGIVVKGIDYRGHGRTLHKNATELAGFTPLDKVFEDFITLEAIEVEGCKGLPTFVMGHSLGGLMALTFVNAKHDSIPNFRGVIAQAPAIRPGTPVPALLKFVVKAIGGFLQKITQPNNLDLTGLCSDQAVVDAYVVDPLNHGLITTRLAHDIFTYADTIDNVEGAAAFKSPFIIYFSSQDKLTNFEAGKLFYERAGSSDKTFKAFEGAKHELHNEPLHKAQIIKDYTEWILKRAA